jgi:hypothetical protein
MTDRAQTQQDFAIGISVFLLAMVFVFAYLPTALTTADAEVEQHSYVAERLSSSLLANLTVEGSETQLNGTRTRRFFLSHESGGDIERNYTVGSTRQVNVTLETLQGLTVDFGGATSTPATAGDEYSDRVAATTTRIVQLGTTRYRFAVRVW